MRGKKSWKRLFASALLVIMCVSCFQVHMSVRAAGEGSTGTQEVAVAPVDTNTHGYDIILVADNSESMWEQQEIRDQALRSISSLAAGSDIRIGGVYFAKNICRTLGLTSVEEPENLEKVQQFLNFTEQNTNNMDTNIGLALEAAQGLLENQESLRKKIIILFSDGKNTTTNADTKTKQQVASLKDDDVDIYCVYLQKKENAENYLKQIVNYFGAESNEQERFKKVTNNEIDKLTDEFAKVFFASQNNMEYNEVIIDSTGTAGFYIPDLGIKKLQLHLKNESEFGVKLTGPGEQEPSYYADGNSWYITVDNPEVGDWTLEVVSENPEQTIGTIAYYAELYAEAEVTNAFKNQESKLRVTFFDQDGGIVESDDAAVVTGKVVLTTVDKERIVKEVELSKVNVGYTSETFTFEEYGTYASQIKIQYKDSIDLTYNFPSVEVVPNAPFVYNQSGTFEAEKTDKGMTFHFRVNELFKDPEGEAVTFNVVQINQSNPVEVTEENGIITVVAEKSGDVEFALDLTDETGETSQVMIDGKVQNKRMMDLIKITIVLAVIFAAFDIIMEKQKKKKLLKKIEAEKSQFSEKYFHKILKLSGDTLGFDFTEKESEWKNLLNSIKELCGDMGEDQIQHWGLEEYQQDVEAYIEKKIEPVKAAQIAVGSEEGRMLDYCIEVSDDTKSGSNSELRKKLAKYQKYNEDADNAMRTIPDMVKKFKSKLQRLDEDYQKLEERYFEVEESLNMPIKCNLILKWREGQYIGDKNCKVRGAYMTGCYSLDSVDLLSLDGPLTVKDVLGEESTGIYVYGYESEENGVGLELRSNEKFSIRNEASSESKKTDKVVLLKGETYIVTPVVGGKMTIKVQ